MDGTAEPSAYSECSLTRLVAALAVQGNTTMCFSLKVATGICGIRTSNSEAMVVDMSGPQGD